MMLVRLCRKVVQRRILAWPRLYLEQTEGREAVSESVSCQLRAGEDSVRILADLGCKIDDLHGVLHCWSVVSLHVDGENELRRVLIVVMPCKWD